jgi:hypothetical protein
MPQNNVSYIEIFHRDDYPEFTGSVPSPDETIYILLEPKFTAIENKSSEFFKFKPRRFQFGVRLSDTSIFDSQLSAHPNYPNLSDYMIRAFDSSDNQVFEGIVAIENKQSYNKQSVDITVYDPLVLFVDSDLQYRARDLQNGHTDPHDFQLLIFNQILSSYFTALGQYLPNYDTGWSVPDWGLGDFQDVSSAWNSVISTFYNNVLGTYKLAAKNVLTDIAHVYDYSKISINRGSNHFINFVFNFIGCIVYVNSAGESYVVVTSNGSYFNYDKQEVAELSSNFDTDLEYTSVVGDPLYNSVLANSGFQICKYFGRTIVKVVVDTNVYNPVFISGFFNVLTENIVKSYLPTENKGQFIARDYPQWRPISGGDSYAEKILIDPKDYFIAKESYYNERFAMTDEGGELMEIESDNELQSAYMYQENDESVFKDAETNEVTGLSVDFEDGLIELYSLINIPLVGDIPKDSVFYKFHINYGSPYPLYSGVFGESEIVHKIGNIGRLIGYLPTDITYAPLNSDNDYIFDVPVSGIKYHKVVDLLKFFLASMNLYCYYTGSTFTLIPTFTISSSTIIIDDADIIDWETQSQEKTYIDASSVLTPTLNYTGNALNPEYNKIGALDVKRATCKISRLGTDHPVYNLSINKQITARGEDWRIEKINSLLAYYDVTLTKYISDPL